MIGNMQSILNTNYMNVSTQHWMILNFKPLKADEFAHYYEEIETSIT